MGFETRKHKDNTKKEVPCVLLLKHRNDDKSFPSNTWETADNKLEKKKKSSKQKEPDHSGQVDDMPCTFYNCLSFLIY